MMATISRKFIEAEKTSTINEQEEVWAHNTVYFTNSDGLDECVDDPDVQNSSFDDLYTILLLSEVILTPNYHYYC